MPRLARRATSNARVATAAADGPATGDHKPKGRRGTSALRLKLVAIRAPCLKGPIRGSAATASLVRPVSAVVSERPAPRAHRVETHGVAVDAARRHRRVIAVPGARKRPNPATSPTGRDTLPAPRGLAEATAPLRATRPTRDPVVGSARPASSASWAASDQSPTPRPAPGHARAISPGQARDSAEPVVSDRPSTAGIRREGGRAHQVTLGRTPDEPLASILAGRVPRTPPSPPRGAVAATAGATRWPLRPLRPRQLASSASSRSVASVRSART